MLTKTVGDKLATNHGINTDHAKSALPGDPVIIIKPAEPDSPAVHCLDAIQYSYSYEEGAETFGAPIKGGITIWKGDKICWDADIPDFTGVLNLYIPCPNDKDLKIMLKSGGTSVIGKLNVQTHKEAA